MDLEKGAAHLRPLLAYEAIDFGFLFVRQHYWQLVAITSLFVLPAATLLAILVPTHLVWLGILVWWCKPIWERALLFTLSRALFEARPSIRETLGAFAEYSRRDWLLALTLRRFSPTRSFDLPVTVLEGSTGRQRAARLGILHRGRFPSAAIMLFGVMAHVEVALALGILMLLQVLTPEAVDWNVLSWVLGLENEASLAAEVFLYYEGLIAMILVAPFYVAGGFSLYLHRRTELEAWDLELAFRRLAERAESASRDRTSPTPTSKSTSRSTTASALLILVVVLGIFAEGPNSALAQPLNPETARESIQTILASEDFHLIETMRIPQWLLDWELDASEDEASDWPEWLADFANAVSSVIGAGLEILLVSLALGVVAWVVYRVARERGLWSIVSNPSRRSHPAPMELFGLQISEESLPADLVAVARDAARAGSMRPALALLYRGALTRLTVLYGAEFLNGATERECLEAVRPLLPAAGTAYLESLTRSWLRCAYGHIEPDFPGFEGLCRDWSRWFEVDRSGVSASEVNEVPDDAH